MSKEVQSASVRAEANCGADAKTPVTSLTREQAHEVAFLELEHARTCLYMWIRGDGEGVDLEADPAPQRFCETLAAMLGRADRALASMQEDLTNGELRALLLIGGTRDLLEAIAEAGMLTPLAGHAVQTLAIEAVNALLSTGQAGALQ